jgi:effector-binding domain-containing protein
MESLPKAGEYAMENGLEYGDFVPGAIFNRWDEEKGETDFLVGIFLKKNLKAGEGMKAVTIPRGNKVSISKFGNYGTGDDEAHDAINVYIQENNLTESGPVYEMYVNDPTTVQPNEIQTDIYYPVN